MKSRSNTINAPSRRWRSLLLPFAIVAGLLVVVGRKSDVAELLATLRTGQSSWMTAAVLMQLLFLINQIAFYQSVCSVFDVRFPFRRLLPIVLATSFANLAAPVGSASGIALFAAELQTAGIRASRAVIINLFYYVLDYASFLLVLTIGLIYLFTHHDLKVYEMVATLILLGGILIVVATYLLTCRHESRLRKVLGLLASTGNWAASCVRRPPILTEGRVLTATTEIRATTDLLLGAGARVMRPFIHALLIEVLHIGLLGCLFAAFRHPAHVGILVAGYGIGVLFMVVSITPQGLGVVETMMTLVFASLGTPLHVATVVTLTYRGLTFWLPFLIGFFSLKNLNLVSPSPAADLKPATHSEGGDRDDPQQ